LEQAHKVLDDWRPRVDATMDDLLLEIGALRKTMHQVVLVAGAPSSVGILTKPGMARRPHLSAT